MNKYLIIRKMGVTEASMDASPITIGFPAVSAIMGFIHVLQRKMRDQFSGLTFPKAGICCHSFRPRIYSTTNAKKASMSRNPPYVQKHLEKGVPFIEEGKADMIVSIVIAIDDDTFSSEDLIESIRDILPSMRLSGGTIWPPEKLIVTSAAWNDDIGRRRVLRQLMPGFALIERSDLIADAMIGGVDALDAVLNHLEICQLNLKGENQKESATYWGRKSGVAGWLVPISVGYRTITPFGEVDNQRDRNYEHAFAENVLTLGEFVMPIRLENVEKMMWRPWVDEKQGLYIYTQKPENQGE